MHFCTCYSTPHVAGSIALMLSQEPTLQFNAIKNLLQQNAEKPPVNPDDKACGGGGGSTPEYPNNAYGEGRVDVAMAMGIE